MNTARYTLPSSARKCHGGLVCPKLKPASAAVSRDVDLIHGWGRDRHLQNYHPPFRIPGFETVDFCFGAAGVGSDESVERG